jgi:hypothetical protein
VPGTPSLARVARIEATPASLPPASKVRATTLAVVGRWVHSAPARAAGGCRAVARLGSVLRGAVVGGGSVVAVAVASAGGDSRIGEAVVSGIAGAGGPVIRLPLGAVVPQAVRMAAARSGRTARRRRGGIAAQGGPGPAVRQVQPGAQRGGINDRGNPGHAGCSRRGGGATASRRRQRPRQTWSCRLFSSRRCGQCGRALRGVASTTAAAGGHAGCSWRGQCGRPLSGRR